MNTENQTPVDLSSLSIEDLKKEMDRRENAKQADREAYKELVQEMVPKALFRLASASEILSTAKTDTFQFFEDILKLKASAYGIKEGQQTHTFSADGGEVTIGYRINDSWDDTVNSGIAKVEKYITSLSNSTETAALVKMVFNLLKKDAKGNLKGSRVLELQKLTKDIQNEEFTDGVQIIADSYKPIRSVWFIEAYLIDENGNKTPIPLSISAVDFAKGYKFEFYNDNTLSDVSTN